MTNSDEIELFKSKYHEEIKFMDSLEEVVTHEMHKIKRWFKSANFFTSYNYLGKGKDLCLNFTVRDDGLDSEIISLHLDILG